MRIIDELLQMDLFTGRPPVLADIGASGGINAKWKRIARYAVCLAFDADDREFSVSEKTGSGFKKLISFNRIVSAEAKPATDFYLTASPFCSSTLPPDMEALRPWFFHSLFTVEKKISLPAITISEALQQAGVDYIDWFKTDTQGTDLRLFKSLPANVTAGIGAAEFEPGIIDAYTGEDKLFTLMGELHRSAFWLSTMDVKGTQRLGEQYTIFKSFSGRRLVRKSPCWAEVTYLANGSNHGDKRQLLMLYIFALLERQYGFALEVADKGIHLHNDPVFDKCRKAVLKKLKLEKLKIPLVIIKKQMNKLLARVND